MSDKHTPGPWDAKTRAEWEGGYDFFAGPENAFVFMADVGPEDIPLINAAPDMLRALRALADAEAADERYASACMSGDWEEGSEEEKRLDAQGAAVLELHAVARELRDAALSRIPDIQIKGAA